MYHGRANETSVNVSILQFALLKIVTKHCRSQLLAIKIETSEFFHTAAFLLMNEEN